MSSLEKSKAIISKLTMVPTIGDIYRCCFFSFLHFQEFSCSLEWIYGLRYVKKAQFASIFWSQRLREVAFICQLFHALRFPVTCQVQGLFALIFQILPLQPPLTRYFLKFKVPIGFSKFQRVNFLNTILPFRYHGYQNMDVQDIV